MELYLVLRSMNEETVKIYMRNYAQTGFIVIVILAVGAVMILRERRMENRLAVRNDILDQRIQLAQQSAAAAASAVSRIEHRIQLAQTASDGAREAANGIHGRINRIEMEMGRIASIFEATTSRLAAIQVELSRLSPTADGRIAAMIPENPEPVAGGLNFLVEGDSTATAGGWPRWIETGLGDSFRSQAKGNSYLQTPPSVLPHLNGSVLDRLKQAALAEVDVVVLMVGINDLHQAGLYNTSRKLEDRFDPLPGMKAAIVELESLGVPVVAFQIAPPGSWQHWTAEKEDWRLRYNAALVESSLIVVDTAALVDKDQDGKIDAALSYDGLHYSFDGDVALGRELSVMLADTDFRKRISPEL